MTRIESKKVDVNQSPAKVFSFLTNFNNFEKIMPEQVVNWSATEDQCSFTIKGMASLGMKISEKTPDSYIKILPEGKVPFDFILHVFIQENSGNSVCQLAFDADLNPFLKMMAEKPLTNFLNLLADKLTQVNF